MLASIFFLRELAAFIMPISLKGQEVCSVAQGEFCLANGPGAIHAAI